jgi:hypothetical protein
MGLINLKTDLKSLKYGNDRPGNGSSNQPYIVTPIPDGLTANGPDFLLRQGALQASLNDVSRLTKFFTDTTSVRGLLFTAKQELLERQNPKMVNTNRIYLPTNTITQAGALFTGAHFNKQGLDPLSPLSYFAGGTEGYYFATRGIGEYPVGQTLSNGDVENRLTIAYTSKILNQSLGSLSINPFGITNLNPNILLSYPGGPNAPLGLGTTNIRIQNPTIKLKDVYEDGEDRAAAISNNPNIVSALRGQNFLSRKTPTWIYNPTKQGASFQYESLDNVSPDKVYIPLFTDNISNILNRETFLPLPPNPNSDTFDRGSALLRTDPNYLVPSGANSANISWSYNPLSENNASTLYSKATGTPAKELYNNPETDDFSGLKNPVPSKIEVFPDSIFPTKADTNLSALTPIYTILTNGKATPNPYPNIRTFNREDTSNKGYGTSHSSYKIAKIGDSTSKTKQDNDSVHWDEINEESILQSSDPKIATLRNKDLIRFFFEINNNDNSADNFFLFFRAYINNLSDSFQAEWQNFKYVGRGENFYRYNGFSREMQLSFIIYAHSRREMIPLYNKLNYLAGTTAPDYSEAGYMRGNFTYITVGDYLNHMPCIIKSISLKPSFDAGWDINRKENGDLIFNDKDELNRLVGQVPRMIDVDLSFIPLHNFTPQFKKNFIRDVTPINNTVDNSGDTTNASVTNRDGAFSGGGGGSGNLGFLNR